MIIFTIIGIVVVVLIIVHYFKNSDSGGSSSSSNRSYSGSATSYSPSSQPKMTPVTVTSKYPNVCDAYRKHYPIIKNSVHKALSSMDNYDYAAAKEVEAEIGIFMFFLTLKLADRSQLLNESADFIIEIGSTLNGDIIDDRSSVYGEIFDGRQSPRVDWGRPVSKYALMHDDNPIKRVYCAFGDYLINPECRTNYFEAPNLDSMLVIQSVLFSDYFENEIFEKVADFTQCFPIGLKY